MLCGDVDFQHILVAILGLSVLIIVHETGHYLAARAFGMRVLQYSIGFGPTLFKWRPKGSETEFLVGAIPFLAYVRVAGMNPFEEREEGETGRFDEASLLARVVTIAAGPFANYLAAVLIFFGLLVTHNMPGGEPIRPPTAAQVVEGSAAAEAGLLPGDVFVSVGGAAVETFRDVQDATVATEGRPTLYIVERAGERVELTIQPQVSEGGPPRIGVHAQSSAGLVGASAGEAFVQSLRLPWEMTLMQVQGMAQMFRQRSSAGMTGPVGIASMMGRAAETGWQTFANLVGLISVAIGVLNLLPFPGLDGGRLTFLGYEVVTRRQPNQHVETAMHVGGILILLCVMVLVTYRDIFGSSEPGSAAAAESTADAGAGESVSPTDAGLASP